MIGVEGKGNVVHRGIVVDEGDGEGRDGGAEAVGDDAGKEVAEGMRRVCLTLLQGVSLVVGVQSGEDLDEGEVSRGVDGQEVERLEPIERMTGATRLAGNDGVRGDAGSGGVGVANVEGGGSDVGRREVGQELVAAGGGLQAGADEAVLLQAEVEGAAMRREKAGEEACNQAACDRASREWTAGGGIGGMGGQLASGFVGLELGAEGLRGEEAAVGWGGAGVEKGVEPKGEEGEGAGAHGE